MDLITLPPKCSHCGYILKPDVVYFGEPIPSEKLRRATEAALTCDVMLIVGTSGVVYPVADLPRLAYEAVSRNLSQTFIVSLLI